MFRVIISVLFMVISSYSWSCSCSFPELKERVAKADTIVVGRIVQLEERKSDDVHQSLKGKVVVKESLKGTSSEEFYLFTGYGQGDCGLGFRVRDEYIFFLNENKVVIGCQGHILNGNTGSRPSCFEGAIDIGFPTYEEELAEVIALLSNGI
jgi:hypothetical protein